MLHLQKQKINNHPQHCTPNFFPPPPPPNQLEPHCPPSSNNTGTPRARRISTFIPAGSPSSIALLTDPASLIRLHLTPRGPSTHHRPRPIVPISYFLAASLRAQPLGKLREPSAFPDRPTLFAITAKHRPPPPGNAHASIPEARRPR